MDQNQEDMKFIGLLGVFKVSFKTILTWKKLFAQITLTLILPLTITFMAHMEISFRLFSKIELNPYQIFSGIADGYRSYHDAAATPADWLYYFLFKTISVSIVSVFSLLSTATIVFTIASVHTGRDVRYRKVMKVVPRIWKRLIVTLLYMFLALFAYHLIVGVVLFMWDVTLATTVVRFFTLFAIAVLYFLGLLYLCIVWQLGSVASVLEPTYGLKAMIKGMDLVKGKRLVALGVFGVLYTLLASAVIVYMAYVEYNNGDLGALWQVMIGVLCLVLVLISFVLLMVSQTVVYLVCKSYHREAIDKVSLSTYLGSYLGEDIQLGKPQPQPRSDQV